MNKTPLKVGGGLGDKLGSHWTVVILDFPIEERLSESRKNSLDVRLRYFDSFGDDMEPSLEKSMKHFLKTKFVGILFKSVRSPPELNMAFEEFKWELQKDRVIQCGVYCIWMFHQFVFTGVLDFLKRGFIRHLKTPRKLRLSFENGTLRKRSRDL